MELKPGMSAIVTGGGSGIGKAICLALCQKGVSVTVIDFSEEKGMEVVSLIKKECMKLSHDVKQPLAMFLNSDVTNSSDMAAAFEKHLATYGGLDICINNAGIGTTKPFHKDLSEGDDTWKRTIDVNLIAVINCTRLAIQAMTKKRHGAIINVASASGLYPMYADPIYSGSKGGVVMFTRSLTLFKRMGIRINALCPEFVQTELAAKVDRRLLDSTGFVPMEMVVNGVFELISDDSKAGSCLWITKRRGMEYWPTPAEKEKYLVKEADPRKQFTYTLPVNIELLHSFQKIVVHTLSHHFRSATKIVQVPLSLSIKPDHALVKIIYAGVNASDVNFSSGRYFSGNDKEVEAQLPFDAGFEAVGLVAAVGDSVQNLKVGSAVAIMTFGAYSEFVTVPSHRVIPVSRPDPEVVAILTSGLTASVALEKAGRMVTGETVLVTAAAGGTGQFAVQLAKLAGNKVVATCGGQEKAAFLESLGVDRVIDYKREDVKEVLKKEYRKGVDIIYESVGGSMFDLCLNALAIHGRLIVIGMISQYQGEHGWKPLNYTGLCEKILAKSQTVAGFFLLHYANLWRQHMDKLVNLSASGKLKVALDPRKFVGLGSVADAVEYLHSGKSVGKVVVCIDPTFSQLSPRL